MDPLALLNAFPGNYLVLLPDTPKFTVVAASEGFLKYSGKKKGELLQKGFFDVNGHLPQSPALIQKLQASFQLLISSEAPQALSNEFTDEALIPLRIIHKPVPAADGTLQYIVHIVEADEQLLYRHETTGEEHRRLQEAQAIGHVGSFTWIAGSVFSHWSDELYRINGLEPQCEVITLDKVDRFIHPEDFDALQAVKESSMINPGRHRTVHRIIRRNGEVRWVNHEWESIAGEDGSVNRVTGIVQDITEQKKAEEEIFRLKDEIAKKATDKYYSILNSIDEGFCIYEVIYDKEKAVDLRWIEVNPAYEKQTGLKNTVGKLSSEVMQGTESDWIDVYDRIVKTGEAVHFESWHEPTAPWYRVFASRIGGKESRQVAVVFDNITGRKNAEKTLRISEQRKAFLLRLSDEIQRLHHPEEMQRTVLAILGRHLDADRVTYAEMAPDGESFITGPAYMHKQLSAFTAARPISNWGEMAGQLRKGKVVAAADAGALNGHALFTPSLPAAVIDVPLVKNGLLAAVLSIHFPEPHRWMSDGIGLLEDTVERIWAAVRLAHTKEALRESEERFRSLVESYSQAVWETNPDGDVVVDSPSWRAYTGQTFEEWIGYGWTNAVHPDDRKYVKEEWKEAVAARRNMDGEYRLKHAASGAYRWTSVKATPILNNEGAIIKWSGMNTDIQARKTAEEQLREFTSKLEQQVEERTYSLRKSAEELQKNLAILKQSEELAQMGSWEYETATGRFNWSEGMYRLFQLPVEFMVDPDIYIRMAVPEDREHAERLVKKIREGTEHFDETACLLIGGERRILKIQANVIRDDNGKPLRIIGVDMDITLARQAERTLNEQAHFIQSTNKALPDILFVMNLYTRELLYINHSFRERMGYAEGPVEKGTDNFLGLVHEDDLPAVLAHFTEMQAAIDGNVFEIEYRIRAADGSVHWFRDRSAIFKRDKKGNALEKIGIAQDITERKKAEQELRESNISLRYANENLQQFASIASHDLQEPLRKLKLFANILMKEHAEELSGEAGTLIDKIYLTTNRMRRLIKDVLDYSKIAHGAIQFSTTDLNAVLMNVLSDLDLLIRERGASIRYRNILPPVNAVPLQMNQLFYNLLINALKFYREDLPLLITVLWRQLPADRAKQYPELQEDLSYIEIVFSDNGIGFEQEFAEQIFQIFERLHPADEYEGTGVGLALCKKIVENHFGHIFAASREGEGASFHVILPLLRPASL